MLLDQKPSILARFQAVRRQSEALASGLAAEDLMLQSMPDASPGKWHLAHTSWFFETFLLAAVPGYQSRWPEFRHIFNSYYDAVGARHPRPERGLLSRPSLEEVLEYRAEIDHRMLPLLQNEDSATRALIELGLHHEQQHQELFLTDLKHAFSRNQLLPAYRPEPPPLASEAAPLQWHEFAGGLYTIGADAVGFAFDNEGPAHPRFLTPFAIASRAVTNGEYLEFINDRGYARPELWLSDGFAQLQREGWQAPLYWRRQENGWREFTLHGETPLDPQAPATHLSYFEADAFATWAGARLPREAEWEHAARLLSAENGAAAFGRFAEDRYLHPGGGFAWLGDLWEWTMSAYDAYPGFQRAEGAVGEYNGKFMNGQYVLRGGSCATPQSHIRPSYRNFFYPHQRWQFSGLRLARDR